MEFILFSCSPVVVGRGLPVGLCLASGDQQSRSTIDQPCMQTANPESLNRWFLTEGPKLAVQLTEQGEISTGDSWKHKEQT